jgi:hypothetical protein
MVDASGQTAVHVMFAAQLKPGTCATTQSVAGSTITVSGWLIQLAAWSLVRLFVAGFTGAVRKT